MSAEDPSQPSTQGNARQPIAHDAVVDQALLGEDFADATGVASAPRVGSPFAVDPPAVKQRRSVKPAATAAELGSWQITAGGAVLAAVMLVFFAAASAWYFPAGTAMTAALGGVMSLLGLSSLYPRLSFGLLVTHLALFLLAFAQMA